MVKSRLYGAMSLTGYAYALCAAVCGMVFDFYSGVYYQLNLHIIARLL
ncbi:MAG: hypothetical protein KME55_15810 [Nostoc indistinguendum CM1-VF10]|nr:hypothetical protein [Nostoc indistinguendum CM1-VF10]